MFNVILELNPSSHYLGCYNDNSTGIRDLDVLEYSFQYMTIQLCFAICLYNNNNFAGLQDG